MSALGFVMLGLSTLLSRATLDIPGPGAPSEEASPFGASPHAEP